MARSLCVFNHFIFKLRPQMLTISWKRDIPAVYILKYKRRDKRTCPVSRINETKNTQERIKNPPKELDPEINCPYGN